MNKKILKIVVIVIVIVIIILTYVSRKNSYEIPLEQWALKNSQEVVNDTVGLVGFDLKIEKMWRQTKGKEDILVGLLDTGFNFNSPNIIDSIYINKEDISENKLDENTNEFLNDINGWDFYNNDNTIYDDYISDYHGNLMASLLVGKHTKNNPVWGVSPNVKILPLKFLQNSEGSIEDAIKAIEYAYNKGVRIINCSWDTYDFNQELLDTINKYSDIVFITSSGKYRASENNVPVYPCSYNLKNLVCVKGVDNAGNLIETSGYTQEGTIPAPGGNIIALLPDDDTIFINGSSSSTVYVTGIVALMLSLDNNLTPENIKEILQSSINYSSSKIGILDSELILANMKK